MSFSVNPDDPTTATINFGVTNVQSAFGSKPEIARERADQIYGPACAGVFLCIRLVRYLDFHVNNVGKALDRLKKSVSM